MRIEQHHSLSIEEVKRRGDALADGLAAMPIPGDVTLGEITREWRDDRMDFSFRVSKGFFGVDIKGHLLVSAASAVLEIKVPPIVTNFVDEEKIRTTLTAKMAEILA